MFRIGRFSGIKEMRNLHTGDAVNAIKSVQKNQQEIIKPKKIGMIQKIKDSRELKKLQMEKKQLEQEFTNAKNNISLLTTSAREAMSKEYFDAFSAEEKVFKQELEAALQKNISIKGIKQAHDKRVDEIAAISQRKMNSAAEIAAEQLKMEHQAKLAALEGRINSIKEKYKP